MGWATFYIEALKRGETVKFRPRGNSMTGRVESGQLVTVEPVNLEDVRVDDVVLCKVKGNEYLHLVGAVDSGRVQIQNNKGFVNGWTRFVYGRLVKVEP